MQKVKWTEQQQRAIDERGRNILVAAAAGSGKTAVLVERIKKLILEENVPIDRMLVVTFTNAAAAEMKEKIRQALYREIEREPSHAREMRRQLDLLPGASISTFHAFALEAIRKFFYTAEIEPGFSICDDAQRTILKEEALDELLEQWFAEGEEEFYDFLNWYSGDRNMNKIREIVDTSYNMLQSLPYPWQWLDQRIEELSYSPEEFRNSRAMEYAWNFIRESLSEACRYEKAAMEELSHVGLERLTDKIAEEEYPQYEAMNQAADSRKMERLGELVRGFSSVRLTAKKEEKEAYAQIKDLAAACRKKASALVNDVKNLLFLQDFDEQIGEMNQTAPKARMLQKLLLDFDRIFRERKTEKKLIDFNDIEHLCLDVLENEDAASYYREKFAYIFIDEYQDTNILQEEIVSRIRKENNLFMVGDVKQSIYKFRLAEPELFKEKYRLYSSESDVSAKIDLNRNFRSKSVLLHEINRVFRGLMEDYDEDAMLYPGVDYDGPCQYPPKLRVVDTSGIDEADEELSALKNTEIEALETVQIIQQLLGKPYYDHKNGAERRIRPRDIVILMRGVRNYAEVFYQILKAKGIDSFVDDSEGYFDTIEINVFMNLLSVIDNKMQDVPLISVLHSEIFRFSAEELGQIRSLCRTGPYWEAFSSATEEEGPLGEKCSKAADCLHRWKAAAVSLPLGRFIWSLLLETGYYIEAGAMPGGNQRQANLRALIDKAESFARRGQPSLYSFVRYIEAVKMRKVPVGQVKLIGENDDLVRIMTIHKSKGLEFPVVIVAGLGRRLNYTRIGSGIVLHKDIGIGMTFVDFAGHWYRQTLLQRLIQKQIHREEVQEEIRILYVAMTRAKDILYLTGTVKDGAKYENSRQIGMGGESRYLDMLTEIRDFRLIDPNVLSPSTEQKERTAKNLVREDIYDGPLSPCDAEDIYRRLDFAYPFEEERRRKSKYSVTELSRLGADRPVPERKLDLSVPRFRQGKKTLTAAEKGTVSHGIMERIDFVRAASEGETYVRQAVRQMVDRGIFTEEEAENADLSQIVSFFSSPIGKRCAESAAEGRLVRERAFALRMEVQGGQAIVQGIIDCYFEEEDGLVLLDYKTNWIDGTKPFAEEEKRLRETYQSQIDIYRRALSASAKKPVKEAWLCLLSAGRQIEM